MHAKAKIVRVPITNLYVAGDYTAQVHIGSEAAPANMILDTGSSAFAVKETTYDPNKDTNLKPTTIVQDVVYGTGGWLGPVVRTNVSMGTDDKSVTLPSTPVAITLAQQQGNFFNADGILGLAYRPLDTAYDLKRYFAQNRIEPPTTWPWRFDVPNDQAVIREVAQFLRKNEPGIDMTPWFTQVEEAGITANKFAFYTLRSAVHVGAGHVTHKAALADPLNQGFFILGGGEEETDLYDGDFQDVKVVSDAYYNANLKAVRVAGGEPLEAEPLQQEYVPYMYSNAIIDSGTVRVTLASGVYEALGRTLQGLDRRFTDAINYFNYAFAQSQGQQGLPSDQLNLDDWPDISFVFEGDDGSDVELTCAPSTYWQTNAPAFGQASFMINGVPAGQPNRSIIGLPLMNNYYTVFDRSDHALGVVKFARIKGLS